MMTADKAQKKAMTSEVRMKDFMQQIENGIDWACDSGKFSYNFESSKFANKEFMAVVAKKLEDLGYKVWNEKMPEHNNMLIEWKHGI